MPHAHLAHHHVCTQMHIQLFVVTFFVFDDLWVYNFTCLCQAFSCAVFHFIFAKNLSSIYKITHTTHLNQCLACSRMATLASVDSRVSFYTCSQWFTNESP